MSCYILLVSINLSNLWNYRLENTLRVWPIEVWEGIWNYGTTTIFIFLLPGPAILLSHKTPHKLFFYNIGNNYIIFTTSWWNLMVAEKLMTLFAYKNIFPSPRCLMVARSFLWPFIFGAFEGQIVLRFGLPLGEKNMSNQNKNRYWRMETWCM